MIDKTTLLIIAAAIVVLVVVALRLLSRKDRELPEQEALPDEMSPVAPPDVVPGAIVPGEEPIARTPIAELLETHSVEELARSPSPQPLGPPDDLTRLKGLGPKASAMLGGLGITRYDQLAALGDDDVDRLDRQMGPFQGRFVRDRWVEQARFLAVDDTKGFEERFGKLG